MRRAGARVVIMGERFQSVRLAKGWTAKSLSEETGIAEERIIEFEVTGGDFTVGELCVLARCMNLPLYYITHDPRGKLLKTSTE